MDSFLAALPVAISLEKMTLAPPATISSYCLLWEGWGLLGTSSTTWQKVGRPKLVQVFVIAKIRTHLNPLKKTIRGSWVKNDSALWRQWAPYKVDREILSTKAEWKLHQARALWLFWYCNFWSKNLHRTTPDNPLLSTFLYSSSPSIDPLAIYWVGFFGEHLLPLQC